jgi:hypothetical protein
VVNLHKEMPKKDGLSKPISIRLSNDVREMLANLAKSTGLQQSSLIDQLLKGACKAVGGENGLRLPIKFQLQERSSSPNDSSVEADNFQYSDKYISP